MFMMKVFQLIHHSVLGGHFEDNNICTIDNRINRIHVMIDENENVAKIQV